MNTRAEALSPVLPRVAESQVEWEESSSSPISPVAIAERYAKDQIRTLVHRLFVPGWPRATRQMVFSPVDEIADTAWLCRRVGEELSSKITGDVCIVEADWRPETLNRENGRTTEDRSSCQKSPGELRKSSRQLVDRLWLMPAEVFIGEREIAAAPLWLRGRLAQLRIEFEYVLLQAPPAGSWSEVAMMGSLSEGVVLILQANSTRRRAARHAQQILQAANARLLGTVLLERTFPIPEGIYRRL